jgi:hypothetical protein
VPPLPPNCHPTSTSSAAAAPLTKDTPHVETHASQIFARPNAARREKEKESDGDDSVWARAEKTILCSLVRAGNSPLYPAQHRSVRRSVGRILQRSQHRLEVAFEMLLITHRARVREGEQAARHCVVTYCITQPANVGLYVSGRRAMCWEKQYSGDSIQRHSARQFALINAAATAAERATAAISAAEMRSLCVDDACLCARWMNSGVRN